MTEAYQKCSKMHPHAPVKRLPLKKQQQALSGCFAIMSSIWKPAAASPSAAFLQPLDPLGLNPLEAHVQLWCDLRGQRGLPWL